ncbi:MAG: MobF family relaxase [Phenylobacterium sp.]|nr:MobF family relaxase [Phenylobacterium sp.]
MLSHQVLTRQDIGDVASYYGDAADDYYAKEGEAQVWQGKGAEALGLQGEVDRDRFRDLLAGRIDPDGPSVRQGTRDDAKTRIGIDLTFSAPKSVSIHALVGGNAAMIAAHDKAVAAALQAAEAMAQARTKVGGKSRLETTGNLVIAKFRHETTRAQDPELHTHAVVMNLTQRADGQWRALKNDEIIKATKYLGSVYRSELAAELQRQGHELRMGREGMFELASMSREQIMAFSQRSQQIEAALAAKGLTREDATTSQLQQATMQTRERKEPGVDREAMYAEWHARARELGIELAGPSLGAAPTPRTNEQIADEQAEAANQAVGYAVSHISERDAVITQSAILDIAIKHAVGRTTLGAVQDAVARAVANGAILQEAPLYRVAGAVGDAQLTPAEWMKAVEAAGLDPDAARQRVEAALANGGLVAAEPRYTTPEALARELQVLAIEKQGRGAVTPIMSMEDAQAHFAKEQLNDGQRASATLILSTPNRVVGIEGLAGTGKSHMLDKAKDRVVGVKAAMPLLSGYNFQALAPYGAQVKALRELGVEARTVAAFLRAADKKIDDKTVLVIDEAGTVPARQMADLLSVAEKAGARVVLVGDRAQTKAIEAGRPFDQLIRNGMEVAKLTEIQRQKDPVLKEAVELAAVGKARASLEKIGHVQEVKDDGERRRTIARDYVALAPKERDQTIIVTGTNEARRELNRLIRDSLGLTDQGRNYDLLLRRDTTQAERKFAHNYNIGDTVQPERDGLGLSRHETYRVIENGPHNQLTVVDKDGNSHRFDPAKLPLSVYETRRGELAIGDVVRITRNDAAKDLANGDRFKVARVTGDSITLSNEKRDVTLPANKPLHVDHAYVTTVHSSQGLTVNRVMYDVMTRSRTVARDIWYVAISRARHEARIYTNSVKDLPRAISRVNEKGAALDLHRNTEFIREKQAQTAARQFNNAMPQAQKAKGFEAEKAKGVEKEKA